MESLKHILLVTDLSPESKAHVIQQVRKRRCKGQQLSLTYIFPAIPSYYFQLPSCVNLENEARQIAEKEFSRLGQLLSLQKDEQHFVMGVRKYSIVHLAERIDADEIVTYNKREMKKLNRLLNRLRVNDSNESIQWHIADLWHLKNLQNLLLHGRL